MFNPEPSAFGAIVGFVILGLMFVGLCVGIGYAIKLCFGHERKDRRG